LIPSGDDRLVLRRFDLAEAFQRWGGAPVVLAEPPVAAPPGKMMQYQIDLLVKGKVRRFRLEDGPPGMQVSAAGLLSWNVPRHLTRQHPGALVSISDEKGRETFLGFWLLHPGVPPVKPPPVAHKAIDPPPAPPAIVAPRLQRNSTEVVLDAPFTNLAAGGA